MGPLHDVAEGPFGPRPEGPQPTSFDGRTKSPKTLQYVGDAGMSPMTRASTALLAAVALLTVPLVAPAVQASEHDGYRLFGAHSLEGDRYDGTFVSFSVADDGLRDLAVRSTPVVERIAMDVSGAGIDGAVVTVDGPNATARVHDVPVAFVDVEAKAAGEVVLDVAQDATASVDEETGRIVIARGVEVAVWSPDVSLALSDDGQNITADLEAGDRLQLRVRPVPANFPAMSAHEPAISRAVESGAVGAEAFVQGGPRAGHAVAVYAALDVAVETGDAIELAVGSDEHAREGKVVVVRADRLALPGDGPVEVTYDGEPVRAAEGGIADVLDPHDDGLSPEFAVASVSGADVVLVSVPHFSVHELVIQRVAEVVAEHPEVAALTLVVGGVVVALAAAGMFRPGKRDGLV